MKKSPIIILLLVSLLATFYFNSWSWFINTFFPLVISFMDKHSNALEGVAATFAILSSIVGAIFWKKHQAPPIDTSKVKTNSSDNHHSLDDSYIPTNRKLDTSIVLDKTVSPFLGLSAFQQKNEPFFFGRQREIDEALGGFSQQRRWLQIEGNSGSGKSSFVNAGLLPLIEKGFLATVDDIGFKQWRILKPMMPGSNPIEMLASVLAHTETGLVEVKRNMLAWVNELEQGDERAFAFAVRECLHDKPDTALLLVVDQFEELFTFAEEKPRKAFDALIANALQDPQCPFFMISTVRADFLYRFELLSHLQKLYNLHCQRYFLPQISEQGLREVVIGPAELAKLDVSSVCEMIIADARGEKGALPLVENALDYLWRHREGNKLSGKLYADKGRLAGLLSDQANKLLASLGRDEKYALKLLLRLTRINREGHHTRRRIKWSEAVHIAGGGSRGENIILHLSGQRRLDGQHQTGTLRLITVSETAQDENNKPTESSIDLIHETLIRKSHYNAQGKAIGYWPKLYDYIDANRDYDIHLQQLQYQSESWGSSGFLGRWWSLASLRERRQYQKLDIVKKSLQGRFLFWSCWMARVQALLLVSLFAVLAESIWWVNQHEELPFNYIFKRWQWQLGYIPEPEMVDIPAGSFMMGCVSGIKCNDDELPVHRVTIAKSFKMGKYEATFEQYDWYVWQQQKRGNKIDYPADQGWGRANRPVINVSWDNATAYIQFLNKKTGKNYRLPSEAEWEYAARAGTKTAYSWGDKLGENKANCYGCGSQWDGNKTAAIGSFSANAFGLYDVHGNVLEWVQDTYQKNYQGVSSDGSAIEQQAAARVLRGGSWFNDGQFVRSANRFGFTPVYRNYRIGFRFSLGH